MRLGKFLDQLNTFSESLLLGREERFMMAIDQLIEGLRPFAKRDTEELFDAAIDTQGYAHDQLRLSLIAEKLSPFSRFISDIAAPMPKRAFSRFLIIVNQHSDMSIRSYLNAAEAAFVPGAPPIEDGLSVVESYVEALRKAQHDSESFPALYGALIADPRLNKDHIIEIASRFAFQMSKSTPKKTALERIWKMHDASQAYVDKAKSMKGKSAA